MPKIKNSNNDLDYKVLISNFNKVAPGGRGGSIQTIRSNNISGLHGDRNFNHS